MITVDTFLKVFPHFGDAPSDLVDELIDASVFKQFEKDSFLYMEGDVCPGIAFILTGEIRVYKVGEGGRELTLYEIFPGETCIMNASCILSWQKYPANAVGITDGSMLYLDESVFRNLVARYEAMRAFIFKYFSHRFTEIIELVEAMAFHKMDYRLTDYLITRASADTLHSTHQQIANDLGTSREVVSRLLKEMERKDKVRLSRNRVDLLPRIHH